MTPTDIIRTLSSISDPVERAAVALCRYAERTKPYRFQPRFGRDDIVRYLDSCPEYRSSQLFSLWGRLDSGDWPWNDLAVGRWFAQRAGTSHIAFDGEQEFWETVPKRFGRSERKALDVRSYWRLEAGGPGSAAVAILEDGRVGWLPSGEFRASTQSVGPSTLIAMAIRLGLA